MLVFTGRYEYTIDDKGRLSVPARLRDQVVRDGQPLIFVTMGRIGQISAFAEKEYNLLVDELGSRSDEQASEALRKIAGDTEECPVDGQGRIVLSARLRDLAGIKRDVVVLGVTKRIEIWDKKRYEEYQKDGGPRIESATQTLKGRADLL